MDLFNILKATLRRWYVAVPVLLLTALYSYHVYSSVKPVYYSSTVISVAAPNSMMVFNTSEPGAPVPRNGLVDASGTPTLVQLTVFGLQDPAIRTKVAAAGGYPGYEVKMMPTPEGIQQLPLAMIDVQTDNPETTQKTIAAVLQQVAPVVRSIQLEAGVQESLLARPITATQPGPPIAAVPSRTKSAVTLLLAGSGFAVLLAVLVDVAIARRRRPEIVPNANDSLVAAASAGDLHDHATPNEKVATPAS